MLLFTVFVLGLLLLEVVVGVVVSDSVGVGESLRGGVVHLRGAVGGGGGGESHGSGEQSRGEGNLRNIYS